MHLQPQNNPRMLNTSSVTKKELPFDATWYQLAGCFYLRTLNVVAIQLKIEELLKMLKYYYKSSFAQKKDDP